MKSQILFVDDEPLILQGLKRSLRPKSKDWDMTFVDSGELAVREIEKKDYDIVVTDMRMPIMNGVELLSEIKRRSPKTVRIILSGHADRHLIMRSVNDTHQFLSKPCDPTELSNVIDKIGMSHEFVGNSRENEILSQLTHIPTLPETYTNLMEQLEEPNCSVDDLGRIIEGDPSMTASLLRIVNSAYFGIRREITSAAEATVYLGTDTIKSLILLTGLFDQCDSPRIDGFSLSALCEHCLKTASVARRFALDETKDNSIANEAYLGGALHDVGKLILAVNDPAAYQRVLSHCATLQTNRIAIEEEYLGTNHATIAGVLFRLWGLPSSIADAVLYHHQLDQAPRQDFSPLTAVHISNRLVKMSAGSSSAQDPAPDSSEFVSGLNRDADWQDWLVKYTDNRQTVSYR